MSERVKISRPDKVMFEEIGYTKADLAEYFEQVAPVMLPHLAGRPLVLNRFPDGTGADGFFQKQAPRNLPQFVDTATVPSGNERGRVDHVLVDEVDDLRFLANQACLELHRWLSRADRINRPDLLVIDLDPPENRDLAALRRAVRRTADLLTELGLHPHLMATGATGYHVVAPVHPTEDFDQVRALARDIADLLAGERPDELTTEQRVANRGDRIYLDINRNAYGQTAITPYSPRARPGAPVATPLEFDELSRAEPDAYNPRSVRNRLARKGDPWADLHRHARPPGDARKRLDRRREPG